MSATQNRPFLFDDPGTAWLEYFGEKNGFKPNGSDFEFLDFIGKKTHQFEDKCLREIAPSAEVVFTSAADVGDPEKVRKTNELMQQGVAVIAQLALLWVPERIYGVPDLLMRTSCHW